MSTQHSFSKSQALGQQVLLIGAWCFYFFIASLIAFEVYSALALSVLLFGLLVFYRERNAAWTLRLYRATRIEQNDAHHINALAEKLSRRAKLAQVPDLYYIPSSIHLVFTVKHANSYVIALSDGVIRSHNYRELAGVIAHEISHIRNHDVALFTTADLLTRLSHYFSWLGLGLLAINAVVAAMAWLPFNAGLLLLSLMAWATNCLLWLWRGQQESRADRQAIELLKDKTPLLGAIEKSHDEAWQVGRFLCWPLAWFRAPNLLRLHPGMDTRLAHLATGIRVTTPVYQWNPIPHTRSIQTYHFLHDEIARPKRRLNGLWF